MKMFTKVIRECPERLLLTLIMIKVSLGTCCQSLEQAAQGSGA